MGEGKTRGPLKEAMKKRMVDEQKDIKFEIKWNTLSEYLHYLEARGISCNVASRRSAWLKSIDAGMAFGTTTQ